MSFALDHIAAVDEHLDQLPISGLRASVAAAGQEAPTEAEAGLQHAIARVNNLQSSVRSLSSEKKALPNSSTLLAILRNARLSDSCDTCHQYVTDFEGQAASEDAPAASYEHELEWLLVGKVTNHAYGLVLDALIAQTLTLNNEIWYWNDVLGSTRYTALYSLQTSPLRFWDWSKEIYDEVHGRGGGLVDGWQQFYGLVRTVIRDKSLADVQRQISSPVARIRGEVRRKLAALNRAKLLNSSGIGYLLSNGFNDESFQMGRHDFSATSNSSAHEQRWKSVVIKSISAMDAVLQTSGDEELPMDDFDSAITTYMADDPLDDYHRPFSEPDVSAEGLALLLRPSEASERLEHILSRQLPLFVDTATRRFNEHGRPPRIVRYWLPAAALLISSTTILRIIVNRKAEMVQWIRDIGATTIDFWNNWVVEPVRKIIGTIRHDEKSEISIISKRSLEGDLASLERMVVDFAVENPSGSPLNDSDIADVRAKVQEGDLTPVLRAYERDLKSPIYGSLRGNLVRTLLIQVQKTKVDVEVAMGGIDNLLKSQELVFGFVGLTPGVLVCIGVVRWLRSLPSSQKHSQQKQSQAYQVLRNIDRILTGSPQSDSGMLSFKEYGLLVCEAIILRDVARRTFPKQTFQEFLQDFNDLIDSNSGVGRQIRVADRIRWAYAKWL